MTYNFHTTYTKLSPKLYQKLSIPLLKDPDIIILNTPLIKRLGIDFSEGQSPELLLHATAGQAFAQAYAGHQFGYFNNLGDGRAMVIGEHITPDNRRFDIQLKGSGKTKYSRGGDGKATMSSMIREYLYSYVMEKLGVKTSMSLAVISTNQEVFREEVHDGAILIRVMNSHIRIGTFEYVSEFCTQEEFIEFTDYVINRHYPEIINEEQNYLQFFKAVIKSTVDMVVDWYRVGFIHGVMNTDNISINGETFDYGPCAFINRYDPLTTFSQIDRGKRYCFANQRDILKWNLAVLGKTLLPLFDKDITLSEQLYIREMNEFDSIFDNKFLAMIKKKLGIENSEAAVKPINSLFYFLEQRNPDYTNTFIELMYPDSINDKVFKTPEFLNLRSELKEIGSNLQLMQKNNPQLILRNYFLEEAMEDYKKNKNFDKINALLEALSSPYTKEKKTRSFQNPPPLDFDAEYRTHCNT